MKRVGTAAGAKRPHLPQSDRAEVVKSILGLIRSCDRADERMLRKRSITGSRIVDPSAQSRACLDPSTPKARASGHRRSVANRTRLSLPRSSWSAQGADGPRACSAARRTVSAAAGAPKHRNLSRSSLVRTSTIFVSTPRPHVHGYDIRQVQAMILHAPAVHLLASCRAVLEPRPDRHSRACTPESTTERRRTE